MRLEGKTALITGAGSGIGRLAAVLFAKEGANVIAADPSEAGLLETSRLVAENARGDVMALTGDVANAADVESWVRQGVERYGAIHVLCNNGTMFPDGDTSVLDVDEDAYASVLDTNLWGAVLCCKYGIPELVRGGGGSVVNIASFGALIGPGPQDAHAAARGGLVALTRSLAAQFAPQRVRINSVSPGPVMTPAIADRFSEEQRAERLRRIPLGRFGRPEDVAYVALFLGSDESSWITGADFVIDGGVSVGGR